MSAHLYRRPLREVVSALLPAALVTGYLAMAASPARSATVCSAKSYGATGNGTTKDTAALQKAINACAGGGVAELTSGRYLTGPLSLPSNITLQIDGGATLLASQDAADYPPSGSHLAPLLQAGGASNVTITGDGTIDGQGAPWWALINQEKAAGKPLSPRPALIDLGSANTAKVTGITIKNAPNVHITMKGATHVTIDDITISSPADSPNTDGIDVWSSGFVAITNSTIDCGDDDLAIDSSTSNGAAHDISLSSSTILHGHGLSIGSYTAGGVYNVSVHDDTLTGTESGVRIKSARDRGGEVHAVTYAHLTMTRVATPILITAYYPKVPADGDPAQAVTSTTPNYHDITISKVTATSATTAGQIVGLPERAITGLNLASVNITATTGLMVRNATVTTGSTTIKTASGPAYILQSNASVS
ncbi:glycoside hydrolase family 28 protein [Actinoallomurus sp. CA-150999]|uniref:glycoside hydrolase family 28 protein n=1 Tax=Actinoallomurus sp. CA-150999 TaxID=3239887 RepID=UPI003D8EEEC7